MKIGGYSILDLKDTPLVLAAEAAVTIPGTYAAISAALANRKAVMVSGLNVAQADAEASTAVTYPDTWGTAWRNDATHVSVRCSIGGQVAQIHVANGDGVTAEVG